MTAANIVRNALRAPHFIGPFTLCSSMGFLDLALFDYLRSLSDSRFRTDRSSDRTLLFSSARQRLELRTLLEGLRKVCAPFAGHFAAPVELPARRPVLPPRIRPARGERHCRP